MTVNIFQPECTTPPEGTNYVKGPPLRSTLSILYSSLLTIFLCTWTVQHLAIAPEPKSSKFIRIWSSFWRKFKWMVVMILAPEFMVGKAVGDFFAAYISSTCSNMKHHATLSGTTWTRTHAYFANMGGIVIQAPLSRSQNESSVSTEETRLIDGQQHQHQMESAPEAKRGLTRYRRVKHRWMAQREWDDENAYYNDYLTDRDELEILAGCHYPFAVNSAHLCGLLDNGLITELPAISADNINNMSKEDMLIKLIALGQVLWLVVELVARKVKGLHTTQLEITALGFAACNLITYIFWLEKPKDVGEQNQIFIHAARELTIVDKKFLIVHEPGRFFQLALYGNKYSLPGMFVRNDSYNEEADLAIFSNLRRPLYIDDIGFAIGGVILGGIHCIAWNFVFPTATEQLLWRIASIITTVAIPFLYLVTSVILLRLKVVFQNDKDDRIWVQSEAFFVIISYFLNSWVLYIIYAGCRLILMVEVFRSLFYSPPDAFTATWSAVLPHVS